MNIGVRPEDVFLTGLHFLFIVFSFAFAIYAEWYWGSAMIVIHALHERIVGDCVLSLIQKRRGYSGRDDDYFYHLFGRLGLPQVRRVTARIHLLIKGSILIIVVGKALWYFGVV
jgi:hypothetical protein